MAELIVNTKAILNNINKLNNYFEKNNIHWTLISKILSGDKEVLSKILQSPELKRVHSIGDSRLSSLKTIKRIDPDIVTMYIKPPAIQHVKTVVKYANISLNTSIETIKALNHEAKQLGKKHRIIIMLEMGELREGVLRDDFMAFYEEVFGLSNILIEGIGTNLGCMYGIEPTYDKLAQLCLYKQLLEVKFKRDLKLISGGSSITLPLIGKHKIPKTVNHFRVGEAAFLGRSPFNNKKFRNLSTSAFEFDANIIEMSEKDALPDGIISEASIGHIAEQNDVEERTQYRAILDFGILDVDVKEIFPKNSNVKFVGTTSDMTVYEIGSKISDSRKKRYKVGNKVRFDPSYMAVARLMNSRFLTKVVK
ncbi:MAG: alanine racemase [Candidatus Cloacimonetes bacterium]|nr:alanine racemase [Candidatus Cloacimonadota bacterium]